MKVNRSSRRATATPGTRVGRISDAQIATLCGVSRMSANRWHREGLKKQPTCHEVLRWLAHREGYAPGTSQERLLRAQADRTEHEVLRRSGQLIEACIVAELLAQLESRLVSLHEAAAGRLAPAIAAQPDGGDVRKLVLAEMRQVRGAAATHLEALADSLDVG